MKPKVSVISCQSYDEKILNNAIHKGIDFLGGISKFVNVNDKILLKPNLCLPEYPECGLTTHPNLVKCIAQFFSNEGRKVYLGDSPVGEASSKRMKEIWIKTGMENVVSTTGCEKMLLNKDFRDFDCIIKNKHISYKISEQVFNMDAIINLPKFKTHSLMSFTGAVKNLYGLLPGTNKKMLHGKLPNRYDFAELLLDIYNNVKPTLNIMDAVVGIEGEGPGKKGKKRDINLLLFSDDAIALDTLCTYLINANIKDVPILYVALKKFGLSIDIAQFEVYGEKIKECVISDFKLPHIISNERVIKKMFSISKEQIEIDRYKCVGCGLCKGVCPVKAIDFSNGSTYIKHEKCIACRSCIEICPSAAIDISYNSFYQHLKQMGRSGNNNDNK